VLRRRKRKGKAVVLIFMHFSFWRGRRRTHPQEDQELKIINNYELGKRTFSDRFPAEISKRYNEKTPTETAKLFTVRVIRLHRLFL
jgi:hypothetical protein